MASETQPLLGAVKKIRAIKDLVYQGKAIRGRRFTRVDGKLGAYDITETPGEEFECDQNFAREAVMSGNATLLSGGQVEVVPQADGFPIYQCWVRDPAAAASNFEKCELLKPHFFGDGCHLPVGSKVRLDISLAARSSICYEGEQLNDSHSIRIFRISPQKVRVSQAETAGKVNALFAKFFPANA
jgi:hypothetical protein